MPFFLVFFKFPFGIEYIFTFITFFNVHFCVVVDVFSMSIKGSTRTINPIAFWAFYFIDFMYFSNVLVPSRYPFEILVAHRTFYKLKSHFIESFQIQVIAVLKFKLVVRFSVLTNRKPFRRKHEQLGFILEYFINQTKSYLLLCKT